MSTKSNRPARSLTDIRTLAGKSSDAAQRGYTNYFEMGALELERLRRSQEREAAMRRIAEIDRRIGEIDAEMARLRGEVEVTQSERALKEAGAAVPAPAQRTRRRAAPQGSVGGGTDTLRGGVARAKPSEPSPRSGLRIRY